jgi:hypothetical protein
MRKSLTSLAAVVATAGFMVVACSSGGSSGGFAGSAGTSGGNCPDWTGSYVLEGTCATGATCSASQTGCTLSVTCSDGTQLSGSLTANGFSFTGTSSGASVNCSGNYDGDNLKGTCQFTGGSCALEADCKSGACGATGGGGSPGVGGGNGLGGAPPGSGGSSFGGSPGSGGGVPFECITCGQSACPEEANACLADATCQQCVFSNPNSPACLSNPAVAALFECACFECFEQCASVCGP